MNARFTRIAVRFSPAAKVYTVVYPEIRDDKVVGVTPDGTVLPISGRMLAVTAGQQTSDAFRLGEAGSVTSIVASALTRKPETVKALFDRNPWNNPNALQFRKALKAQ